MHFSPFKVSSQGNGKSATFASSPVVSQSHLTFLVRLTCWTFKYFLLSGWLRTASLGLPFTLGFREFKRASSVFVSMETGLGVVHPFHVPGNLKRSLGRTSQGDTSGLSGHFPAPSQCQFRKERGTHIFLDNGTALSEWLIQPFKALACILKVTSVCAHDHSQGQVGSQPKIKVLGVPLPKPTLRCFRKTKELSVRKSRFSSLLRH